MSRCGGVSFEMAFDAVNPEAVAWAETRAARLIVEVQAATRQAVREIVSRAIREGIAPRQSAKLIREVVGLTSNQARAVANLRSRLVAKGVKAPVVEKRLATYAARLRRQRALTIARTETMRAANEGQRQLWRQARAAGYLSARDRRVWVVTPDDRACEICVPLGGQTATLEGTFPNGLAGPPAHPNCRCVAVLALSD